MHNVLFDHSRTARIGLPEAVFCEGKEISVVQALIQEFYETSKPVLFTRLNQDIYEKFTLNEKNSIDYDPLSRTAFTFKLPIHAQGSVAIVSAGTADAYVTYEAARTLEYLGISYTLYEDSGVAGLWRLASRLDAINEHDVVIIVAGLDAALASVLGGLTPKPVFAVPTSIGYGIAEKGKVALGSMLASCAPGVAVLNIDNGYGAACACARIINNMKE